MKALQIILTLLFLTLTAQGAFAQDGLDQYVDGENFRKARNYEKAIHSFEQALAKEPTNYEYLFAKGLAEYQNSTIKKAEISLRNLLKEKYDYAPAYILLGKIYHDQNNDKQALAMYDSAAKFTNDINERIRLKQIIISTLVKERDFNDAYIQSTQLIWLIPNDLKSAYHHVKIANITKHHAEAVQTVLRIEKYLKNTKAEEIDKFYYELGYAYYHLENYKSANQAFAKVKSASYTERMYEFSGKYAFRTAFNYFKLYEDDIAQKYINLAEKIQSELPEIYVLKAQLSKRKAFNSTTIDEYKIAAQNEHNPKIRKIEYDKVTEMHLINKNYSEAVKSATLALTLFPEDNKQILLKGIGLYHIGDYKVASQFVQNALKSNTSIPIQNELQFVLGEITKSNHSTDNAKTIFTKLLHSPLRNAAFAEIHQLD